MISGNDQLRDLGFEIDYIEFQPSTSSERLVLIHTPQVQRDDQQHMTGTPQPVAVIPKKMLQDHVMNHGSGEEEMEGKFSIAQNYI